MLLTACTVLFHNAINMSPVKLQIHVPHTRLILSRQCFLFTQVLCWASPTQQAHCPACWESQQLVTCWTLPTRGHLRSSTQLVCVSYLAPSSTQSSRRVSASHGARLALSHCSRQAKGVLRPGACPGTDKRHCAELSAMVLIEI